MQKNNEGEQLSLFGPDLWHGKTCPDVLAAQKVEISSKSSNRSSKLKNHTLMVLNLQPGAGNMLGPCWEYDPAWLGPPGTLNTSECPSAVVESSLSQILLDSVPSKYYLSATSCKGMLKRAEKRGKKLPEKLEVALKIQARLLSPKGYFFPTGEAFHINQRDEGIDLQGVSGALMATQNMQMQTFVTQEKVFCLNDQGGERMDCFEDQSGTLLAQTSHAPVVYENHGIDGRYTGPHSVVPTMSARYGTGGNNVPFVTSDEVYCIVGNVIDRQPENGGNGQGFQKDIAYTLTATDYHAVFCRQRVDVFREDEIASTQSARQYKDATDLVLDEQMGIFLLRRLVPQECERLQGYPDHWTNLPAARDSVRYKSLGNSVAIPCVEFLLEGIAEVLRGGQ